jgi:hypothetical protein
LLLIFGIFPSRSQDSSVGIAKGYGLDGPGPESRRTSSSPQLPDRLWGLAIQWIPGGLVSREQNDRGVKLITHLHLVRRSREVEIYLQSPRSIHALVLNELNTVIITVLLLLSCLPRFPTLHIQAVYIPTRRYSPDDSSAPLIIPTLQARERSVVVQGFSVAQV